MKSEASDFFVKKKKSQEGRRRWHLAGMASDRRWSSAFLLLLLLHLNVVVYGKTLKRDGKLVNNLLLPADFFLFSLRSVLLIFPLFINSLFFPSFFSFFFGIVFLDGEFATL